jgi:hypothetical protein
LVIAPDNIVLSSLELYREESSCNVFRGRRPRRQNPVAPRELTKKKDILSPVDFLTRR